jgi:hypothetical protein
MAVWAAVYQQVPPQPLAAPEGLSARLALLC